MNEDMKQTTIPTPPGSEVARYSTKEREKPNASEGKKPVRIRRVGTITMGISLIIAGVLALYAMFHPSFDIWSVLKYIPVVFIFLGLELLTNYFIHTGERLQYDVVSTVLCFFLIFAVIGIAAIPQFQEYFGPQRYQLEQRLGAEAYDESYSALSQNKDIVSLHTSVHLYGEENNASLTTSSLGPGAVVDYQFVLKAGYANKAAFAAACADILQTIQPPGEAQFNVSFESEDKAATYHLEIGDQFSKNLDAASLEQLVRAEHIDEPEPSAENEPSSETI